MLLREGAPVKLPARGLPRWIAGGDLAVILSAAILFAKTSGPAKNMK